MNLAPGQNYEFRVRRFGYTGADCLNSGPEFNPLQEVNRYNVPNPYQDPTRGRIVEVTADENGSVVQDMREYLGNLSGHESIAGRSIHLTPVGALDPVACCAIGDDKDPYAVEKKAYVAPQPVTPAYNPGYGFYRGPAAQTSSGYGQQYGGA
jgi:hypothetical protein